MSGGTSDPEPVPEHFEPLGAWLEERIPMAEAVELLGVRKASSGFSAETVIVDVVVTRAGIANEERYVLRTESPEPPIYPVQVPGWGVEIELQYRIMEALGRHSDVPVAPMIGYDDDRSLLGTPFFVMGFVDGQVPVEDPPYTTAGFFLDVVPADRRRMIEGGLGTLARVHALDWRAAGLDWLVPAETTPGLDAQLALWEDYNRAELRDRVHPLVDRAFAWLHAERPAASPVGLCWGDPRPGNIIWRDATPVCVTDFEAASIAPPELDVGWWLMFDRTMHEGAGVDRPAGDPTRAEQLRTYEEASGRAVPDARWFEICAATRYCAIVVRVMNRAVDRGLMPEDQIIWRENPAVTALESLLAEM
jgi:aminoglycoside phosphotransferase (APT) family kinase protein